MDDLNADIPDNWGNDLKTFRKHAHLMQDKAAELLGVSQAYISRLESGSAQPSKRLKARLDELMVRPEHRTVTDQMSEMVKSSPHIMALLQIKDESIIVHAISKPMFDNPDAFRTANKAGKLPLDPDYDIHNSLVAINNSGLAENKATCVTIVWSSAPTDQNPNGLHWKTIVTPIRNENDDWLGHCVNLPITAEEKRQHIEDWNGNTFVKFSGDIEDQHYNF